MIKKIDYIRSFGVFKNFNWADTAEFQEKNIFYGWNYSGKTTLSRIFSSLRDQQLHDGFPGASFKVTHTTGATDHQNLSSFPYAVAVFNSEYAKENLRLEFDENINAIFFEVGENAKIEEQIQKIKDLVIAIRGGETIKGQIANYQSDIDLFDHFEVLFTNEARKIKNDAFSSLIEFDKRGLRSIKDRVSDQLKDFIIKSATELEALSKTVKVESPKPALEIISFETNFRDILHQANELLSKVPAKSKLIKVLDSRSDAYDWAQTGLSLHKENDKCLFCDNTLTEKRYNQLLNYFQNESSKLRQEINRVLSYIDIEKTALADINLPLSINDLNEGFQPEYEKRHTEVLKEIEKYKKILNQLSALLNDKLNNKLYKVVLSKINAVAILPLEKKLGSLREVLQSNNKFVEDFDSIIKLQRDKYKDHLVARFLKDSSYNLRQKKYEKAKTEIKKLEDMALGYEREIDRLQASKESDAEGCAQFNSFVQSFLNRDDITIQLNADTKKFNLMREAVYAKNLSEGEKMAIAFSHFLVYLKSIERKNLLSEYVIYIDDPISSLDSNHIFQINSLLKDIFFSKVANPDGSGNLIWKINCKQLFISTHNFEFFNLLKELPVKGFKRDSRYYISRKVNESHIEKLPKVYNTFASEYHYLFGEIRDFHNETDKSNSSKLLLIPNVMRRFVEMYTLAKYPTNDEVDVRAEMVFGKRESKRIIKLLHYFSHFNNMDRIHKHSELVADIEHACNDLINLLKKDTTHYTALEASLV